ncbi:MAG: DUF2851 family protein [Chloroflexi bacterium]|nr:DUF2851 family protein [Chloroflexota bacterium]MCY3937793.1 DUF2851 family protein [Chloroflexota bacterium]
MTERKRNPTQLEARVESYWLEHSHSLTNLMDHLGRPVEVVYGGRRSPGAGPDIEDAIISFDGGPALVGDLEVHIDPNDWFRHGHDGDSAYSRVILHVVWSEPGPEFKGPPTIALNSKISIRDLPARGDPVAGGDWPCVDNFRSAGRTPVVNMLALQGWQRVLEKSHACEADVEVASEDQVLYSRVLDALGYSQNREPFRALAKLLTWEILKSFAGPGPEQMLVVESVMFGTAGLLPTQRAGDDGPFCDDEHGKRLAGIWETLSFPSLDPEMWRFHGVRPGNWPTRRIAAACRIFSTHLHRSPSEALLNSASGAVQRGAPEYLEKLFLAPVASGDYWARRIDFGRQTQTSSVALLGTSRAREIVVNVAMPMAVCMARSRGDDSLIAFLRDLNFSIGPVSSNRLTRYMASLTGAVEFEGVSRAARQQGMLNIYRRWCRTKSCRDCAAGYHGAENLLLAAELCSKGAG